MRSRTATWFECKISYEKTMEDGLQKKVNENYTVDALSFTEAEKRIMEEMSSYISGEFSVKGMTISFGIVISGSQTLLLFCNIYFQIFAVPGTYSCMNDPIWNLSLQTGSYFCN